MLAPDSYTFNTSSVLPGLKCQRSEIPSDAVELPNSRSSCLVDCGKTARLAPGTLARGDGNMCFK